MTDIAVETAGLAKRYGNARTGKTALVGLDLTVERGEVFGFLGPNGAGKTTTIRLLLDLIRPTSGTVRVLGADPRDNAQLRVGSATSPGTSGSTAARPDARR